MQPRQNQTATTSIFALRARLAGLGHFGAGAAGGAGGAATAAFLMRGLRAGADAKETIGGSGVVGIGSRSGAIVITGSATGSGAEEIPKTPTHQAAS